MEFSRFYGGSNVLNGGSNGISWDPLVKPLQKKTWNITMCDGNMYYFYGNCQWLCQSTRGLIHVNPIATSPRKAFWTNWKHILFVMKGHRLNKDEQGFVFAWWLDDHCLVNADHVDTVRWLMLLAFSLNKVCCIKLVSDSWVNLFSLQGRWKCYHSKV